MADLSLLRTLVVVFFNNLGLVQVVFYRPAALDKTFLSFYMLFLCVFFSRIYVKFSDWFCSGGYLKRSTFIGIVCVWYGCVCVRSRVCM